MKVSNKNCRSLVEAKQPFMGSNLYAEQRGGSYVVFSYGEHYPMIICKPDPVSGVERWFFNSSKYSSSTSRHLTHARPDIYNNEIDPIWVRTFAMRELI
jgi:hypothetical protein